MNRGEGCAVDEDLLSIIIMLVTVLIIAVISGISYGYKFFTIKYRNRKSRILREQLLEKADYYLEPYSNIWTYQKLVCSDMRAEIKVYVINIENDSEICKIKGNSKDIQYVWNDVLKNFSNEISYYELVESLHDWHFDKRSVTFKKISKHPSKPEVREKKSKKIEENIQKEKSAETKKQEIKNERQIDL